VSACSSSTELSVGGAERGIDADRFQPGSVDLGDVVLLPFEPIVSGRIVDDAGAGVGGASVSCVGMQAFENLQDVERVLTQRLNRGEAFDGDRRSRVGCSSSR
jgi:hypothetical protein